MTGDDKLTLELAGWMRRASNPGGPVPGRDPDYLVAVLATTRAARQRPSWAFPLRWLPWQPVESHVRLAVRVAVATLLLLVILATLLVGWAGGRGFMFGDAVLGSGWRLLDGVRTAEWNLNASVDPWTGAASGRYFFERDGSWFAADVACLVVIDRVAVVGGPVTRGNINDGAGFLLWLRKGGEGGVDDVSFTLVSGVGDPMWPATVPDVPRTCPGVDLPPGVEWRENEGSMLILDRPNVVTGS